MTKARSTETTAGCNLTPLTFEAFAAKYCARQENTPDGLRTTLCRQRERFQPDGWFMLECDRLDSSRCGELVILPYGGTATCKTVPDHPISPSGLASDMSTVCAVLPVSEL